MKYCGQCGSKLPDVALFCESCGHRLVESRPKENAEAPQGNQFQNNAGFMPSNTFLKPNLPKPKKGRKKSIIAVSLVLAAAIVAGIFFGKPIATQISYILNPGVTAAFEAQIPKGETEQQIKEKMIRISYMTDIRLINLRYNKATVSVDDNVVTVKHIPKNADINKVVDYIISPSYTAEIQDTNGNTIVDNTEFSSVLVLPGVESDTQYKISVYLTLDGEKTLKEAIKPFATQQDEQSNLVLIANGEKIATMHISAEEANGGNESTRLSFIVPTESKIDLTLEELIKVLNSCGNLPYVLSLIGITGITGKGDADSTKTYSGESNNIDNTNGDTSWKHENSHPADIVGTYVLTNAKYGSLNLSIALEDFTLTLNEDGTYVEKGILTIWDIEEPRGGEVQILSIFMSTDYGTMTAITHMKRKLTVTLPEVLYIWPVMKNLFGEIQYTLTMKFFVL